MFAARFDPTKALVEVEDKRSSLKAVLPLKRTQDDLENSESEDTDDEELSESSVENEFSEKEEQDQEKTIERDPATDAKHSSVISRFQKTLAIQDRIVESQIDDAETEIEEGPTHDLAPIPQPEVVRDFVQKQSLISKADKSIAWQHTEKIHYDNSMVKPFNSYKGKIEEKLLQNIEKNFSVEAFPIQTILLDTILPTLIFAQSISKKLFTRRCGDVLVNASTGSGKTLAYSIPIVQSLSNRTVNRLRCLVIVPTKILIHQVFETFVKLSQGTSLIVGISKMESSLAEEHKKFSHQEPDILITTPGRLVDHLQMASFTLKNLKFLVLDEADRLLNQSFQNWCEELMTKLKTDKSDSAPGNVMKMVFSATLTTNTEKLHNLQLNKPKLFMMDSAKLYNLPRQLQEYNIHVPTAKSSLKPLIALRLLMSLTGENKRVLIFVRSNESSIRLARLFQIMIDNNLNNDLAIKISSINSNNSKGDNKNIINEFSASPNPSELSALISTDVMSRGVDISNITHVINYDLPISSQQYVHRCGRTARANTSGLAYNILVGKGERKFWLDYIDTDLSRDSEGCQMKLYSEDEGADGILQVGLETETIYKVCLQELQKSVLGH